MIEKSALKELSKNRNIVIKPADKGGAVIVMDTTDYINEGFRQLSDSKFYIETDTDMTHEHALDINGFIQQL